MSAVRPGGEPCHLFKLWLAIQPGASDVWIEVNE